MPFPAPCSLFIAPTQPRCPSPRYASHLPTCLPTLQPRQKVQTEVAAQRRQHHSRITHLRADHALTQRRSLTHSRDHSRTHSRSYSLALSLSLSCIRAAAAPVIMPYSFVCLSLSLALTLSLSVACRLQTGWLPLLPLVVWRLLPAARPPSLPLPQLRLPHPGQVLNALIAPVQSSYKLDYARLSTRSGLRITAVSVQQACAVCPAQGLGCRLVNTSPSRRHFSINTSLNALMSFIGNVLAPVALSLDTRKPFESI